MADWRYRQIHNNGQTLWLPRVWAILSVINKPGLNDWRANLGSEASEQISQETRDIGSEVHKFIAQLTHKEPISKLTWTLLSEEIKNGIRAYVRYCKQSGYQPLQAEIPIYSLNHHYACTIDSVGVFPNDCSLGIVDWKTNDIVWDEYIIQIAAYFIAWNEAHPKTPAKHARIVNLDRNTGIPQEKPTAIIDIDQATYIFEQAFLPAKSIFVYLNRNETHSIAQNKQEAATASI